MIFFLQAFFPFDHTRHTEAPTQGASKMRRDSINGEVMKLRDLLPLPPSTRFFPHIGHNANGDSDDADGQPMM